MSLFGILCLGDLGLEIVVVFFMWYSEASRRGGGGGSAVKLTLSPPSLLYLSKRQGSPPRRQARVCGDQCLTKTVSLTGITLGVALLWLWFLLAAGVLLKCIITNRNAGGASLGLGEGLESHSEIRLLKKKKNSLGPAIISSVSPPPERPVCSYLSLKWGWIYFSMFCLKHLGNKYYMIFWIRAGL